MSLRPGLCGVILAAGESTRMGTDKASLPWPPASAGNSALGQTFLSAAIEALSSFTEMVIVVAGKNESTLAPIVFANAASLVRNPKPERGQFSSMQVGLQEVLNHGRDAALVTLVDRPPAGASTLQALCDEFPTPGSGTWAVVPQYGERHGHPILLTREMIEVFLKAPANANAREIEHECQQHILYLSVDDPSVAQNIDTPQDYAALSSPMAPQSR
jgi:molybdenum cofactor cytidylyltransferase